MDPINGFRSAAFTRIDISFITMLASLSLHHHSSCRINFNPDICQQLPYLMVCVRPEHNKLPLPRALLTMLAWYDVQASTIKGSRLMVSLPQ